MRQEMEQAGNGTLVEARGSSGSIEAQALDSRAQ